MTTVAAGLTVLASSTVDDEPPPLAGFIVSSFSPLVAEAAERCLRAFHGEPPVVPARGARTALVIASPTGDVASAVHVAASVDAGTRVGPLLFFQSVPNAVAGYVAARWGLAGPVVCVSPAGDPMAEGLDVAVLLMDDGDADEALVVVVEQGGAGTRDRAAAVLVRTEGGSL
jgi:3-oxoacyl-(acyl-carrier-protein) synthase